MNQYNHTKKLFANGEVTLSTLKVMLVSGYTFSAAEEALTQVTAVEVSGNGWPVGGPTIANAAITVTNTNDAKLDGDNVSITASGGDIGPATALVVVDSSSNKPLFHYEFPTSQTAGDGTPFNINWAAEGIADWSDPA